MNDVSFVGTDEEVCGFAVNTPEGLVEIQVCLGLDGTPLVYIDTPDWQDGPFGPKLRVWLNDDTVYEGVAVPVAA